MLKYLVKILEHKHMTQHLIFKIQNNTPSITFKNKDGEETQITKEKENLDHLIQTIANKLEMEKIATTLQDLMEVTISSDEGYVEMDIINDDENSEFNLEKKLEYKLNSTDLETHRLYESEMQNLEPDVKNELMKNHKSDLFSSFLAYLYDTMIDKVRLALEDLEIDQLHIEGLEEHPILIDRLSKAMEHLGVEVTYFHEEEID